MASRAEGSGTSNGMDPASCRFLGCPDSGLARAKTRQVAPSLLALLVIGEHLSEIFQRTLDLALQRLLRAGRTSG
jgi:hypothetical protein